MFSKSVDFRAFTSVVVQVEAFKWNAYFACGFLKVEPRSHSIPQFSQNLCDSQSMSVVLRSDSGFWPARSLELEFSSVKIRFQD